MYLCLHHQGDLSKKRLSPLGYLRWSLSTVCGIFYMQCVSKLSEAGDSVCSVIAEDRHIQLQY
jgi:hypothetical protein